MAAAQVSASLCLTLLSVSILFTSAVRTNVTAEPGQTVILPCKEPNNEIVTDVTWNRPDLGTSYVLAYQNSEFDSFLQHPSYVNRADLQEVPIKGGDVSLRLKNVTIDDEGTYECLIFMTATSSIIRDIREIVHLSVAPPAPPGGEEKDGCVGLKAGLSVFLCLLLLVL